MLTAEYVHRMQHRVVYSLYLLVCRSGLFNCKNVSHRLTAVQKGEYVSTRSYLMHIQYSSYCECIQYSILDRKPEASCVCNQNLLADVDIVLSDIQLQMNASMQCPCSDNSTIKC